MEISNFTPEIMLDLLKMNKIQSFYYIKSF